MRGWPRCPASCAHCYQRLLQTTMPMWARTAAEWRDLPVLLAVMMMEAESALLAARLVAGRN